MRSAIQESLSQTRWSSDPSWSASHRSAPFSSSPKAYCVTTSYPSGTMIVESSAAVTFWNTSVSAEAISVTPSPVKNTENLNVFFPASSSSGGTVTVVRPSHAGFSPSLTNHLSENPADPVFSRTSRMLPEAVTVTLSFLSTLEALGVRNSPLPSSMTSRICRSWTVTLMPR